MKNLFLVLWQHHLLWVQPSRELRKMEWKNTVRCCITAVSYTHLDVYKRQLQYGTLQQKGLTHFDSWASTFGETIRTAQTTFTEFSKDYYDTPTEDRSVTREIPLQVRLSQFLSAYHVLTIKWCAGSALAIFTDTGSEMLLEIAAPVLRAGADCSESEA